MHGISFVDYQGMVNVYENFIWYWRKLYIYISRKSILGITKIENNRLSSYALSDCLIYTFSTYSLPIDSKVNVMWDSLEEWFRQARSILKFIMQTITFVITTVSCIIYIYPKSTIYTTIFFISPETWFF